MSNQLYDNPIGQIAFVVNNVEKAKEEFAEKFGFEEIPGTGDLGDPEVGQTMYKGMYCPDIQCKIANFSFGSFSVEIMEPNEVPSAWRDWLDKHGEGVHHIAYFVEDIEEGIKNCQKNGMELIQTGQWSDGNGCYAYLDTCGTVSCMVELLQIYPGAYGL